MSEQIRSSQVRNLLKLSLRLRIDNTPNLAVCIKPLFKEFNRALNVVEFIEFYKLLGATHFVFYNLSIGDNVEKVLHHYHTKGEATIMK